MEAEGLTAGQDGCPILCGGLKSLGTECLSTRVAEIFFCLDVFELSVCSRIIYQRLFWVP